MKIKELEEAMRIERLDHDDYLDAAIKFRDEFNEHPNAPILEAAKTMLELMKARESATGGEWTQHEGLAVYADYQADGKDWATKIIDIRGWGHLTGKGNARGLEYKAAKEIQIHNAKFITLAANITRETN